MIVRPLLRCLRQPNLYLLSPDSIVITVKNFPFFAPTMESFGEKSAKMGFTKFSRVPAYIPVLVDLHGGADEAVLDGRQFFVVVFVSAHALILLARDIGVSVSARV